MHSRLLAICNGIMFIAASMAFPFCLEPTPRRVCAEYFHSQAVFSGKVISQRQLPEKEGFDGGWLYRIKVGKSYCGPLDKFVEIISENNSGRFNMEVGSKYLLFANKCGEYYSVDNCGNSDLLSRAKTQIQELEKLKTAADCGIEGRIISWGSESDLKGIRIVIQGEGIAYEAATDNEGWFYVGVPPGRYSLHVQDPSVIPFDLSYDDPSDFFLVKGRCVQVQLVRK